MLHPEILSEEQKELLPLVKLFRGSYCLVGGTAIALQLGHRRSLDFDLFTAKKLQRMKIKNTIGKKSPASAKFIYEAEEQLHLKIKDVKITFFQFPYDIPSSVEFKGYIKMPDLLTLAAMKAFAFAERAKWKDYVDMYFLLKNNFQLGKICKRTEHLFNIKGSVVFTEKLFRQQLCYFKDIDYSESVEYLQHPVSKEEIKNYLTEISVTPF